LRRHPVARLTIAGGFGKLSKLAAGHLDLHSGRSQVDLDVLASLAGSAGASAPVVAGVRAAHTALDALRQCAELGDLVAGRAREVAREVLRDAPVEVDVVVIDRAGTIVGRG
ncbi:MAG TPA: cobalt-precorrin-5B (C(1))-methyltransferase, partial [Pseudonocardiaceae bacterium]